MSSATIQPGNLAATAAKPFTPLHGLESAQRSYQRTTPPSADIAAVLLTRWATPPPPHARLHDIITTNPCSAVAGGSEETFFSYQYNPLLFEVPQDPFCSLELSTIPLHSYVDRLLKYLCPGESLHDMVPIAFRLIDRYHSATRGTITNRNVHLVFGVAMMTAVKLLCESRMLRLSTYAHILGVSTAECLRTLEVILLFECRWNLLSTPDEYAWYAGLLMASTAVASSKEAQSCETIFPSPSDTLSFGSGVSCDMLCLSNSSQTSTSPGISENDSALKNSQLAADLK